MGSLPDIVAVQKQVQRLQCIGMRQMANLKTSAKETYTEAEAAAALGITVARLHQLLDQHIFTTGCERPQSIQFTASDLLLLSYWNEAGVSESRVIPMPKRK